MQGFASYIPKFLAFDEQGPELLSVLNIVTSLSVGNMVRIQLRVKKGNLLQLGWPDKSVLENNLVKMINVCYKQYASGNSFSQGHTTENDFNELNIPDQYVLHIAYMISCIYMFVKTI